MSFKQFLIGKGTSSLSFGSTISSRDLTRGNLTKRPT
ncbi:unnamed protein product, partial [Rotaria magnacalcarata]